MNGMRKGKPDAEGVDLREIIARVKSQASLVTICEDYGNQTGGVK